ncbi:hypothetical protein B0H14DRAFT_2571447 [Mycena olivaceomarginata]|nr:hypothetical protein B0H14DRAFT_2571447 [Mycena olivaceomarginata]
MSRKGNPPTVFERSASVEKSKCHALCMRFAPPPHELVTRTPALDDVHQTVDTLGMLLRRGRFVLAGSVLSNLFVLHSVTHFACALHLPSWACHQDPVKMKGSVKGYLGHRAHWGWDPQGFKHYIYTVEVCAGATPEA